VTPEKPSSATVARITLVVVGVLVLLYGVYLIRNILVLVLVALFIAIALDPLVRALIRWKFKRGLAVGTVFFLAVLVVVGFFASITPPLVRQTQRLAVEVPRLAENLSDRSEGFRDLDERYNITDRVREAVKDLPSLAAGSAGRALGIVRSVGSTFFNVLTVAILAIYFMLDWPRLIAGASKLVAKSRRERVERMSEVVFTRISGYMLGNLAISAIAGVTSFIVLTIIGVPYALPLALWVALADLIPMVGASLGAIPAVIVGFFDGGLVGIVTLVFFLIYQQVENYVVSPRVMKQAVDISPAAVILSALIGATLLGFVGALIAIPIAASAKVIAQEIWLPRQEAA
jgi:predicted PurR-regulated permease PerM